MLLAASVPTLQIDPALCATPCKNAGRLVLPFVCANKSATGTHGDRGCTTCNSCLLLSDGAQTYCTLLYSVEYSTALYVLPARRAGLRPLWL